MTTTLTESKYPKLIHVALLKYQKPTYLFLRSKDQHTYVWFSDKGEDEEETSVSAPTLYEAMEKANRHWRLEPFRMLNCGFRYTLPERDEHGINALFHQMASSYDSMNGIYFDPGEGNNCFVNFASQEAIALWRKLKKQGRL